MTDVFSGMIGTHVWGLQKNHGSHIFMEFGEPKLSIREPKYEGGIIDINDAVHSNFRRRLVVPVGRYSLLTLSCCWTLSLNDHFNTNSDEDRHVWDKFFFYLNGQKLVAADLDETTRCLTLKFDLGAVMVMFPSPHDTSEDDQWSLRTEDGRNVCYTNGGVFSYE